MGCLCAGVHLQRPSTATLDDTVTMPLRQPGSSIITATVHHNNFMARRPWRLQKIQGIANGGGFLPNRHNNA